MGGGGTCLTACFGAGYRPGARAVGASHTILRSFFGHISGGLQEVLLPAHCSQTLDQFGLHIWPRGDHFLMGLANKDGSFTGTLYLANEGDLSFSLGIAKRHGDSS